MNTALKKKWVQALRSGKYKQASGKLGSAEAGYCCLGVLRCINDPKDHRHAPDAEYLSNIQLKEFGLSWDIQERLASLNDYKCKDTKTKDWDQVPFELIAWVIDEGL